MSPRNKGQEYEDVIKGILKARALLPSGNLEGNDAGFIHRGTAYFVEVKNSNAPDFGQKGLTWSPADGWKWRQPDAITGLYDELGVISLILKNSPMLASRVS